MSDQINILVGDKLANAGLEYLNSLEGVNVDVKTGLSEDEICSIIGDYDGLIIRSGVTVTAKILANPGKLKAIARAGVGVDNIDLDAATKSGVLVMNSAEASTITTAEHAFALMTALARNIGPAYARMSEGGWDRNKFVGMELEDKTLGVVGFGRIGQTMARKAVGFGMKVLAFDPVFNAESALDGKVKIIKSFEELVSQVDVLSFHVPLNDHTRGMLNAEMFAKAKPGMMIINAARGGVIDLEAMKAAIESGQCGGAAIDVYEKEPLEEGSDLRGNPKILLTPHLGASTSEAQEGVSTHACSQIYEYLSGQGLRGAVNASGVRLDLDPTQTRYLDLAQRMAKLIAPMCEHGIADITVTLQGQSIASAQSTIERMVLVELLNELLDEPVNVVNAKLFADQRGIKLRSVVEEEARTTPVLTIDLLSGEDQCHISGTVYTDGHPRILHINGYHMDIIPAGPMMILLNEDKPGMVGLVGTEFGDAGANIADLALSRSNEMSMMVLKLDAVPSDSLKARLLARPGILKVATVALPELPEGVED